MGITPTCVGNTTSIEGTGSLEGDHPHLRGEYPSQPSAHFNIRGSPPLAWGIRCNRRKECLEAGITPTCVGNTHRAAKREDSSKDHPHLRGEYLTKLLMNVWAEGSPPLAWGIRVISIAFLESVRITPTCVGNTVPRLPRWIAHQDHPHLRGEYQSYRRPLPCHWGSPPLAWGILR